MGINGLSTVSNMPQNCGMAGMHGNSGKKIDKEPVNLPNLEKLSDGVRGQKIDLEA